MHWERAIYDLALQDDLTAAASGAQRKRYLKRQELQVRSRHRRVFRQLGLTGALRLLLGGEALDDLPFPATVFGAMQAVIQRRQLDVRL